MSVRNLFNFISVLVLLNLFCASVSFAQKNILYTDEEAKEYIQNIVPKPGDYKFTIPPMWTDNLASEAEIVETSPTETTDATANILDGDYTSYWKTNTYEKGTYALIDLGKITEFDRLVIFNVYSDARGTGGGNNSLKKFEVVVSNELNGFKSIGEYEIKGPKAQCIKKSEGGQICFFIHNTSPEVVELPKTSARYVKIILKEAYWGESAFDEWKSSFSLSEVMLFNSNKW